MVGDYFEVFVIPREIAPPFLQRTNYPEQLLLRRGVVAFGGRQLSACVRHRLHVTVIIHLQKHRTGPHKGRVRNQLKRPAKIGVL